MNCPLNSFFAFIYYFNSRTGKSSLVHSLIDACSEEQWFVLGCKFDKQAAPHTVLAKAFNDFFGKWGATNSGTGNTAMQESCSKVCVTIFATMDHRNFRHLCDLVPNFAKMFPLLAPSTTYQDQSISSLDKIGSANQRRINLFNVLFKSLCSAGRPVLVYFDDLQWSDSFCRLNFLDVHNTLGGASETCRQGLLHVGTFRSNEVKESDDLIKKINYIKQSGKTNVTMLTIGELTRADITSLISSKLCLPWRYVQDLATVVHDKTLKGNPFFVIQFIRSIIQNKLVEFSVKHRRFTWDCDIVDMQMISDDVAKLLTTTFSKLPTRLMQTVKIVSCLGSQVEESTIELLNLGEQVLPCNMLNELDQAVKEGIMEKAGPMYQFTHDIVQSTIYELIPAGSRKLLHKTVGDALLKSAANDPTIHLLAVDQINKYCRDNGDLSPMERAHYADCNATAAKFAVSTSSFEQG